PPRREMRAARRAFPLPKHPAVGRRGGRDAGRARPMTAEAPAERRRRLSRERQARYRARQRKVIYETLHPEAKLGNPGVSRQVGDARARADADRFTKDTAKATGKSERANGIPCHDLERNG